MSRVPWLSSPLPLLSLPPASPPSSIVTLSLEKKGGGRGDGRGGGKTPPPPPSVTPSLYCICIWLSSSPSSSFPASFLLGSGPEGADDLCIHIQGNFLLRPSVRPSVRPFVHPSICPALTRLRPVGPGPGAHWYRSGIYRDIG